MARLGSGFSKNGRKSRLKTKTAFWTGELRARPYPSLERFVGPKDSSLIMIDGYAFMLPFALAPRPPPAWPPIRRASTHRLGARTAWATRTAAAPVPKTLRAQTAA